MSKEIVKSLKKQIEIYEKINRGLSKLLKIIPDSVGEVEELMAHHKNTIEKDLHEIRTQLEIKTKSNENMIDIAKSCIVDIKKKNNDSSND